MQPEEQSWADIKREIDAQLSAPQPPSDRKPRRAEIITGKDSEGPLPLPYIICNFRKPWYRRLLKRIAAWFD